MEEEKEDKEKQINTDWIFKMIDLLSFSLAKTSHYFQHFILYSKNKILLTLITFQLNSADNMTAQLQHHSNLNHPYLILKS